MTRRAVTVAALLVLAAMLAPVVIGLGSARGSLAPLVTDRPSPSRPATAIGGTTATATTATSARAVVTVTPSPAARADAPVSGGDLGRALALTNSSNTGSLLVTAARWTSSGAMAPPAGRRYLVVTLTVTCTGGTLALGSQQFIAVAGTQRFATAFGASLDPLLPHRVLRTGQSLTGQIGFVLDPGEVRLILQDENLTALASAILPAP